MNILYDKTTNSEDRHTFKVNQGGEINLRVSNGSGREVTIIFRNRKFHAVEWNIDEETWGKTRSAWWVRGAIAAKIKELEDYYDAPKCASDSQHNETSPDAGEKGK